MLPSINQSSLIAFYLLAAFIVFITVRGELSAYVGFFQKPQGQTGPTSASVPSSAADQLTLAQTALLQGAQLAIIA